MSSVLPFDFDGDAVRVVMREDEPWFVAKDICGVLSIGKHRDAVSRLEDDERGSVVVDTLGGSQKVSAVSESGLYALIFTSRKPEARRFRKWVTSEVLPAIRRQGRYEAAGHAGAIPSASLRLKPALRAQAMHTAVQTAKLGDGCEEDVKRLYAEFCHLFSAKSDPAGEPHGPSDGPGELVREFIAAHYEVVDVVRGTMPRRLKTQAIHLYKRFVDWCREEQGIERDAVPSHNTFGRHLKQVPGVVQVSPTSRVFYNLVPTAGGD